MEIQRISLMRFLSDNKFFTKKQQPVLHYKFQFSELRSARPFKRLRLSASLSPAFGTDLSSGKTYLINEKTKQI